MRKCLLICAVLIPVLFFGCVALIPVFDRGSRRAAIIGGEGILADAYRDYTNGGSLPSTGSSFQVCLSSNLVSVGGTQYQCLLELRSPQFLDRGTLAMTTNRAYIWLDSNGPPKIIHPGYRPTAFGF